MTAGTAGDGTDATNAVAMAKAALGINLNARYNGTTSYTSGIQTNGLLGEDSVTGVSINNANVYNNLSNFISAVTGANGYNLLNNYTISSQASGTATTGAPATTSTNTVTLTQAPLGVGVSGTYNGTTTLTTAGGATITANGLVGQDASVNLTSATLNSANVADTKKVVSVTGDGTFDLRNYVLNGNTSGNTQSVTAGTAGDGTDATNAVALVVLPPPPANPILVPAFVDNGVKALASDVKPTSFGGLNYVQAGGLSVVGSGSTLNFVSSTSASPSPTAASPSATAGASTSTGQVQPPAVNASEQVPTGASSLNFVSSNAQDSSASTGTGNRKSTSDLNVNNVTVPSASGPLDVFVVDTGVNRSGVTPLRSID